MLLWLKLSFLNVETRSDVDSKLTAPQLRGGLTYSTYTEVLRAHLRGGFAVSLTRRTCELINAEDLRDRNFTLISVAVYM